MCTLTGKRKIIKNTVFVVAVFVSSSLGLCAQSYTKAQMDTLKMVLIPMCKMMLPPDVKAELKAMNISEDCYCEVSTDVTIEVMINQLNKDKKTAEDVDMAYYLKFMQDVQDENSALHNEFLSKLEGQLTRKCYQKKSNVIVKGPANGIIPLLKVGNNHKLEVVLGNSTKYYLMDTGADICVISDKYANELRKNGIIKMSKFQGNRTLVLGDNSIVDAAVYLVDGVKIGNFTLDNVEFAVIDGEIGFLLGQSVLKAFYGYHVNNNDSTLELVK
ncbi:MAG: retroviral-like aspartic protease family protein [Bacteroidales bacterium]|jgi:hypothetical protein|nr:retroviral-like aspartic protease family protein [Bacteroidales bacterium]